MMSMMVRGSVLSIKYAEFEVIVGILANAVAKSQYIPVLGEFQIIIEK